MTEEKKKKSKRWGTGSPIVRSRGEKESKKRGDVWSETEQFEKQHAKAAAETIRGVDSEPEGSKYKREMVMWRKYTDRHEEGKKEKGNNEGKKAMGNTKRRERNMIKKREKKGGKLKKGKECGYCVIIEMLGLARKSLPNLCPLTRTLLGSSTWRHV